MRIEVKGKWPWPRMGELLLKILWPRLYRMFNYTYINEDVVMTKEEMRAFVEKVMATPLDTGFIRDLTLNRPHGPRLPQTTPRTLFPE